MNQLHKRHIVFFFMTFNDLYSKKQYYNIMDILYQFFQLVSQIKYITQKEIDSITIYTYYVLSLRFYMISYHFFNFCIVALIIVLVNLIFIQRELSYINPIHINVCYWIRLYQPVSIQRKYLIQSCFSMFYSRFANTSFLL